MARRRRPGFAARSALLAILLTLTGLGVWRLNAYFEDRHWRAFSEAGVRALERGNYAWAEKMLRESLQYAQAEGDDARVRRSYQLLAHLHALRGEPDLAEEMRSRALEHGN